jgi:tape measure domain-containing protein
MAPIDDKVVAMSFESGKFESGVDKTLSALDRLKASLKLPNAAKGFDDINKAAQNVQLGHIGEGVDNIKNKLQTLKLVGIGVLTHLANLAVDTGMKFVRSFALGPLQAGFQEYSTNLNAVQTILANTQASGATLKDVNAALLDLNKYSDKTIYNFSQMAKNIGTFTAAGVDLSTSTQAIKGIANLAALSGSNADQASTAMYQLSQAISAGRVSLQDWNSVVNAGMGGTVFQRALAQTAEAMGTLKDGAVKLQGPMKNVSINGETFRESIGGPGPKWLTSDVLTTTLKQFTGDLSDAQLHAQGFNDAQIKAIQQTAKTAQHAATEVKTISQVIDVAKETAGSGWAQTWQIIFGNFGEAKTLFTGVSNAVNGFINASSQARNKVLGDWKALGGRTVLINSIKTAFHNLGEILKPIKEAFRDIFPPATGKDLYNLTLRFRDFANALKPSAETVDNLKRTFKGFFALLDIGKQIIGGIFTVFGQLFGAVGDGSGSFLSFTGNIGDFLVSVDKALRQGGKLHSFFVSLGTTLAAPIRLLGVLKDYLSNLFGGFSPGGFSDQMNGMTKAMSPFQKIVKGIGDAWHNFLDGFGQTGHVLQPALDAVVKFLEGVGPAIGHAISGMNFEVILQTIRTGLFTALIVMLRNFFGKGSLSEQLSGVGGGIFKNIAGSFKALQGSMVAMQQNIKADTLQKIAIAIALLTASVVALSFVNPDRLTSAIVALGFMFAELLAAMAILDKISSSRGFLKLPLITASMILLAGAIDLLTIAVFALSKLSWEELAKGLGAVAILLGAVAAASIPLSANSAGMIRAGIGIIAIAVAMKILASAVGDFADMSWTALAKGLTGVAVGLGVISATMQLMPKGLILQGTGLVIIAAALKILAGVVERFSGMDWRSMGKGLLGVGGALVVIAGAMNLMPGNVIFTSAGLLLVAVALGKIANAVESMGGMSIREIAKGLGTLAGSLGILAAALYLMSGTLAGAVALGVAAAGLALLAPALLALGRQSWTGIIKGLATLAGALTILGLAGLVLTPVIPSLLGLGAALILIGGGLALAGAGIALIGVGLSAIAVAGPAAIAILVQAFIDLSEAIPKVVENTVLGLLKVVQSLSEVAPQFVDALVKILDSLLNAVILAAPKIAQAFGVLLDAALKVLTDNQGKVIQAGLNLLLALINGISNNVGKLVTAIVNVITNLLNAIASNLGRIITAGGNILVSLITGIVNNYARIITTVADIIARFVGAIASNLGRIVTAGLSIITKLLEAIAGQVSAIIRTGTDVIVNFIRGVGNAGPRIIASAVDAIGKFITAIAKGALKLTDEAAKAILVFLNGITAAINTYSPQFRAAGGSIALALANGVSFGLAGKAAEVARQGASLVTGAVNSMLRAAHIKSPSADTMAIGQAIADGLALGMSDSRSPTDAAKAVGNSVIKMFTDLFQTASPSKVMRDIGRDVNQGFAEGIRGDTDSIKSAFTDLNNKLTDEMANARETIASEQEKLAQNLIEQNDKLKEINKEKFKHEEDRVAKIKELQKQYASTIADSERVIAENENVLTRTTAAHVALTQSLQDEKVKLLGLSKDYVVVTDDLKNAQDMLIAAQKARDDAIKSYSEQYSALPDIVTKDAEGNAVDQLATYMGALQNQADAVTAYQSTLDQLRQLGLDDATYQKLLKEGPADQQFASQLLAGGVTAVESLNVLDKNLQTVSKTLATNAARNLCQAGVDAAQGLVDGLESKKGDIRKQMESIAREMIHALRKELGAQSPSEEFATIGRFAIEGLAKGLNNSSKTMTNAVVDAGKNALSAMKQTMRNISDAMVDEINPNPVITPILDLTQVRAQGQELAGLTNVVPITAATSYNQASRISAAQGASQAENEVVAQGGTSVKFEQNNYSPKALSEIEIYRLTRNQLSQLRSLVSPT